MSGTTQDRMARPFTCTVHAPQAPMPQPYFAPLRPRKSRSAHSSGMSGSASKRRAWPLTLSVICMVRSGSRDRILAERTRARPPRGSVAAIALAAACPGSLESCIPRCRVDGARHEQLRAAESEIPEPAGLHRRAGPERRQHPEGPQAVRHRGVRLVRRQADDGPDPRHAYAYRHEPRLQRRPHPGRDPVRGHHGPRHPGPAHRRIPLGRQAGRPDPQGGQGPRGRGRMACS